MSVIEVNHITKEYRLGYLTSFKDNLRSMLARLRGQHPPERKLFKALDDIDFNVMQGEVVGIIGPNGAGKSTLLKILSNVVQPTSGTIHVEGKIAPLIEVGAGLVGDLTGRENIFLNSSILGIPRSVIKKKMDDIISFAELEEFIDTPIKRYSSGMKVRLGFAIATSIDADILIVDEVLAVGDLAFQRKCFDRMEELIKRRGNTVLLVSHNIRQVERMCSRVILLEKGRMHSDGDPHQICDIFYALSDQKVKQVVSAGLVNRGRYESTGDIELLEATFLDSQGNPLDCIAYKSNIILKIVYKVNGILINPQFGVGIHTIDFLYLATEINEQQFEGQQLKAGVYELKFHITEFPILPGVYSVRLGVNSGELTNNIFYQESVVNFQVESVNRRRTQSMQEGFVEIDGFWTLEERSFIDKHMTHQKD